jgi:hypothetical protein
MERLNELDERARTAFQDPRTLGEIALDIRELRETAYEQTDDDVRRAAESLKAFHELLQMVLWVLLGFAEQGPDKIATLAMGLPRATVRHRWRSLEAQFTTSDADNLGFPRAGGPFQVVGRGPLDGVYVCLGYIAALGEASTFDVTGRLLRELELPPV